MDLYTDPEHHVAERIDAAEAQGDLGTQLKWVRVRDAVQAMLRERRVQTG
jgi:hypothetical protein